MRTCSCSVLVFALVWLLLHKYLPLCFHSSKATRLSSFFLFSKPVFFVPYANTFFHFHFFLSLKKFFLCSANIFCSPKYLQIILFCSVTHSLFCSHIIFLSYSLCKTLLFLILRLYYKLGVLLYIAIMALI